MDKINSTKCGVLFCIKYFIFSIFLCLCLLFSACCTGRKGTEYDKAKQLIREGKAECVLLREGKILHLEKGRGVSPLLAMSKKYDREMAGGEIVDKVIGRAAAAIAINAAMFAVLPD